MEFGYVSALNCEGRTVWIADSHRGDGKRFVVRADEKLTAFLEVEAAIRVGTKQRWTDRLRRNRVANRKSSQGEVLCSPSFATTILILRTVQRSTASYARSSCPSLKRRRGFVRYYWLDTGKGEAASVSVFRDKAGADESVHLAAEYVKEHLSKFITQKPEIIEGPIKAHD